MQPPAFSKMVCLCFEAKSKLSHAMKTEDWVGGAVTEACQSSDNICIEYETIDS